MEHVTTEPRLRNPKTIDIEGIKTVYYDQGMGEPIVFIYGGNFGSPEASSSAHVWDLTAIPLANKFRTIAFDKLGQGFTDIPRRDEDYTMAAVVRHAAKLIESLELYDVNLVGHSRGGFAAMRLALEFQYRVKSLTLVSSGTLSPLISPNELAMSGNPHPPFSWASSRWVYENYCHDPRAVTDSWIDRSFEAVNRAEAKEAARKMGAEGLATRYFLPKLSEQKRETLTWLREGRLQRPTQIIWGANDRTVALPGAFELFGMISPHQHHSEISIFNHCGHFAYREHPARFNALLTGFIEGLA